MAKLPIETFLKQAALKAKVQEAEMKARNANNKVTATSTPIKPPPLIKQVLPSKSVVVKKK